MTEAMKKPQIVILGGGFAGVYTALALEKALGSRNDFDIVLVNKENYFVFQPMLPEVISGTIGLHGRGEPAAPPASEAPTSTCARSSPWTSTRRS